MHKWQVDVPKEPGFYWTYNKKNGEYEIVQIDEDGDIHQIGDDRFMNINSIIDLSEYCWLGPLEIPDSPSF
jgi:hypothetical protein